MLVEVHDIGKKILLILFLYMLTCCKSYHKISGKTYYSFEISGNKIYKISFERDSIYLLVDDKCNDFHRGIWKKQDKKKITLYEDDFGALIYDYINNVDKKGDTLCLVNKKLLFISRDVLIKKKELDSIFNCGDVEVIKHSWDRFRSD